MSKQKRSASKPEAKDMIIDIPVKIMPEPQAELPGPEICTALTVQEPQFVRKVDAPLTPTGVLGEVDRLLGEVAAGEAMLDVNWMRLGSLLEEVQVKEYWRGKYSSFGTYIMEKATKYKRGRSQLYNYIATVHALKPYMNEVQLLQIGIAKARALTDGIKATGTLPTTATAVALDPDTTVEQVKEAIFKGTNAQEKGEWFALTGFPVTKEERATLNQFFELARRTDPAIPKEWKPWQVLKETLLRGVMEYINTYAGEVETFDEEASF